MSRHVNIPIFIPHLGCPNQCVFCNQRTISGVENFDSDKLRFIIDEALSTIEEDADVEIAFFGGSFTGIDFSLMVDLLEVAYAYVRSGRVSSVRCSTRPDYIDERILDTLKKYGVKVIELGLQSSSEEVLYRTKRGHSFEAEQQACKLIKDKGFSLVGQMMIGLPGSDEKKELDTADFIISAGADAARIYPTVVFHDTELCKMTECGDYRPLSLEEAVSRSSKVLSKFVAAGVEVIRIGLCASDNLLSDKTYHSGPNHSAIGELVENELYYTYIYEKASQMELSTDDVLKVSVAKGCISKAVGQKKRNKLLLLRNLGVSDVRFSESGFLSGYEVSLSREERNKKCT